MYLYKLFNLTRKFCKNEKKRTMLTGLSIGTVFPVSDLKSCIKIIRLVPYIPFPGTDLIIVQKNVHGTVVYKFKNGK